MPQTYKWLKEKDEEELIRHYNDLGTKKAATQELVLLELQNRLANKQRKRIEEMTRSMKRMTAAILMLKATNVGVFARE
jgi:uncharacterized coiled-coil protein SlyX